MYFESAVDAAFTKSLAIDKIKQILIAELNFNPNFSKIESNNAKNVVILESVDNEIEHEFDEDLHMIE